MADSSKIVLDDKNNGEEIEIDSSVLEVIMGIAAEKVDGVAAMHGNVKSGINRVLGRENRGKGIAIKLDDDHNLIADVYVSFEAGSYVPKVAMDLQKSLRQQVLQMTDLVLKEINVHVTGLVFPDDPEEQQDNRGTSQLFSDIDEKSKNESTPES
ncbi:MULTISPECIES: Asp23/Gls24 family envelope stress response protein [unclassified Lactobacillus]|uniref:Asp23/Gls24 family envelope stress response protein n=1 Tax=unclassified Lactobacillus TaxID=2620435 RepID=UPI000EFBF727|nr:MULTISPECIES: Asp23/Gls24 family envelope stress response protein [unclassified Lactobacillus]RMC39539.1 Asp23/Gls24 family envelope stress response protein [Lactobacillus sp. ESL0237]RMC43603.1 Asp23/Gls24 family envelope stress response protein [Lactobacillus sp. ESL0234]RMC45085.1 Asp23/Gls24 family envelope stress response protein [Lactobacillus sp. ESL0236]RMC49376.1 Asp23/Gls24 family envelope stress response protein [Lactobacillus sp. ESL0225]